MSGLTLSSLTTLSYLTLAVSLGCGGTTTKTAPTITSGSDTITFTVNVSYGLANLLSSFTVTR